MRLMHAAFISQLPWCYPGHGDRWGSYGWHLSHPAAGLIHVGVTAPHATDSPDPVDLRHLVNLAPPRMCFAFAGPRHGSREEDFCEVFDQAVATAEGGDRAAARKLLKDADRHAPMSSKICRGFIELTWSVARARNQFAAAVSLGEQSIRPGFCGVLPWEETANRPFLVALRSLAWCSWRGGDVVGARRTLESLLWLEPSDALHAAGWLTLIDAGVTAESVGFPALQHDWWTIARPPGPRWRDDEFFPEGWT